MTIQRTGQIACHRQVADVAKALTGKLYESLMGNDAFWRLWRGQNPDVGRKELERRFIERNWPQCIGEARKALTMVLTSPDASEEMKERVMDVLEKDASLRGIDTPFEWGKSGPY